MNSFISSFDMHKKFFLIFIGTVFVLEVACLLINIWGDPYNFLNSNRTDFITTSNERSIKSVYLSHNLNTFDSVLIGSSRSSYIDVSQFPGYRMFNYSVSGISIDEYIPYLRFFEKTQGAPKLIILSLDFHNTNANYSSSVNADEVISDTQNFKYLIDYFKIKNAYLSLKILNSDITSFNDYYSRELVKKRIQGSGLTKESIKETIDYYRRYCFWHYTYRLDYKDKLEKIKNLFPNTRIIVIICPIHQSLIQATFDMVDAKFYQKWIQDIGSSFGKFYDFTMDETIVNDSHLFFDPAHFYSPVGKNIVSVLSKETLIK